MQALGTKMAAKAVEKSVKKELKSALPDVKGPRRRTGDGVGDKVEGCCNRCCGAVCRTSPWTQVICWAMIALVISTAVVWLGGAFLVGPAKKNTGKGVCGVQLNIPLLNKDAYVWYLSTSGIIVLVMLFSSCLCCCSVFALCCGNFPKAIKIIGALLFIIVCLALSVYVGWIAIGTYFAIEIRSADTVCRNMIVYLCLLYIYLVVLALVGIVLVVWKCHDIRTKSTKSSTTPSHKVSKSGRDSR